MDDLLASLTPAQRDAVLHVEGPLLVLAGPGSGKTRVVTHRIAHLLRQGVFARQILALTFTNKAAEEMRRRVEELAPGEPVWISTFHRFAARLLRQYAPLVGLEENYTIYDTDDSAKVLKQAMQDADLASGHFMPSQIAAGISLAKNRLVLPDVYQPQSGNPISSLVADVYPAYQTRLRESNAVDFDDLLLHIATLLREQPEVRRSLDARYRFILVDEYQDTNLAQYTIVRAMSINEPNLAVTGDPDQSIYGWRGAHVGNILNFEQDYPQVRVVRLEQNYRSTKRILRVADALIVNNRRRLAKDLFTDNAEGRPVGLVRHNSQREEAEAIVSRIECEVRQGRRRPRDFAIFYRVNALTRPLESAFREHGIAYQMVNAVEFYQRREIKDVLAYLALLNNPRDNIAFQRVINVPARGIGKTTIARLREHADRKRLSMLDAAREAGLIEKLATRSAIGVARFVALIDRMSVFATRPVEEILKFVLAESGYKDALATSPHEEDQQRLANIEELLTAAQEFDAQNPGDGHLEAFLENVCLVNDTDAWEMEDDRVTLMTLHASKGLEFPVVYIIGVEEKLIPHERSLHSPAELEEERRLLFVGITRAREELHLSHVKVRDFRGQRSYAVPSSFLMELPRDEMQLEDLAQFELQEDANEPLDDDWDPDAYEREAEHVADAEVDPGAPGSTQLGGLAGLKTAAELAGISAADFLPEAPDYPTSPHVFAQGMVVRHPEYGLGKIVAISGRDDQRKATVAFVTERDPRTFVLKSSPLRPVE